MRGKRISWQKHESNNLMTIENVLASVAVKDIKAESKWYAQLLGQPGEVPVP